MEVVNKEVEGIGRVEEKILGVVNYSMVRSCSVRYCYFLIFMLELLYFLK